MEKNKTNHSKFRTAAQAFDEIKRLDPDTALTKNYIRTLIASGSIPIIRIGNKKLVEMTVLSSHLDDLVTSTRTKKTSSTYK